MIIFQLKRMKSFLITGLMLTGTLMAAAQEVADTVASQQLQEVTILAPEVVRKADMDVYYPSRSAWRTRATACNCSET